VCVCVCVCVHLHAHVHVESLRRVSMSLPSASVGNARTLNAITGGKMWRARFCMLRRQEYASHTFGSSFKHSNSRWDLESFRLQSVLCLHESFISEKCYSQHSHLTCEGWPHTWGKTCMHTHISSHAYDAGGRALPGCSRMWVCCACVYVCMCVCVCCVSVLCECACLPHACVHA
jgi:hypothetical protein